MKVGDIIKNLDRHNLEFSVVHFNKKVKRHNFNENLKDTTVNYLRSKGYQVYSNHELYNLIFLDNYQNRLLLVTKEDSDSDIIIVSREDLLPYIKMIGVQDIPDYYRNILKKFKDTDLYTSIEKVLYHIGKQYTLSELSAESCMTSRNFTRQFKEICGMSFLEFYRPFKMELAKGMLNQGEKICDVADKLGFNEPSYFNRVFKTIVGMAPGTYREFMTSG
ncbi:hypothetical protein FACS1894193_08730 [Bacilli bacterium]|nr:hypothetical protein FACS1894193_08730 [Bacilli bacterium]GHU46033.1 hypothetical protein FACS1894194_3000 [Bacilli bacterium]